MNTDYEARIQKLNTLKEEFEYKGKIYVGIPFHLKDHFKPLGFKWTPSIKLWSIEVEKYTLDIHNLLVDTDNIKLGPLTEVGKTKVDSIEIVIPKQNVVPQSLLDRIAELRAQAQARN